MTGIKKAKAASKNAKQMQKNPVDIVDARENVTKLVRDAAIEIALGVIEGAKAGQLASAKYLFEVAGLYPAAEEAAAARPEDSLAYILLKRMGLPTEPVIREEDQVPAALGRESKAETAPSVVTPATQSAGSEDAESATSDSDEAKERKSGKGAVQ